MVSGAKPASSQPSPPSLFSAAVTSVAGEPTVAHWYSHRVGEVPARTGGTTNCAATPPVAQPTTNTIAMIPWCFMAGRVPREAIRDPAAAYPQRPAPSYTRAMGWHLWRWFLAGYAASPLVAFWLGERQPLALAPVMMWILAAVGLT